MVFDYIKWKKKEKPTKQTQCFFIFLNFFFNFWYCSCRLTLWDGAEETGATFTQPLLSLDEPSEE